jgi:hypothetical protein
MWTEVPKSGKGKKAKPVRVGLTINNSVCVCVEIMYRRAGRGRGYMGQSG